MRIIIPLMTDESFLSVRMHASVHVYGIMDVAYMNARRRFCDIKRCWVVDRLTLLCLQALYPHRKNCHPLTKTPQGIYPLSLHYAKH